MKQYDGNLKRLINSFQKYTQGNIPGVFITKLIEPRVKRAYTNEFMIARQVVTGLTKRGCFKEINTTSVDS